MKPKSQKEEESMTKETIVQTIGVLVAVATVAMTVVALIAVITGFEPS